MTQRIDQEYLNDECTCDEGALRVPFSGTWDGTKQTILPALPIGQQYKLLKVEFWNKTAAAFRVRGIIEKQPYTTEPKG